MRSFAILLSLGIPCAALLKSRKQETHARAELKIPKGSCHTHGVFEKVSKGQFSKLKSFVHHQPYQEEDEHDEEFVNAHPYKRINVVNKKEAVALQVDVNMTDGERKTSSSRPVFLRAIGHSYHGTTALSQLIMSSNKVATLCKGETWECEGGKFMVTAKLNHLRRIEIYEKIWDLRKPVFYEKWAVANTDVTSLMKEVESGVDAPGKRLFFEKRAAEDTDVTSLLKEVETGVEAMSEPTNLMKRAGIPRLDHAFVLLWRPLCLMVTSSHRESHAVQVKQDVSGYRVLLKLHAKLVNASLPVLVVNYGDLLFKPAIIEKRMYEFAPKLGKLDSNYKVVPGKDVFTCNRWKPQGSIKEYGQSLSASKMHYNPNTGKCGKEKQYEEADELLALSRK